jgi:hypothetical protein
MHACVDLRDPRVSPFQGKPQVVVFNLGRGGVPQGRLVAGKLSDTTLCARLNHFRLCIPVLSSRGGTSE